MAAWLVKASIWDAVMKNGYDDIFIVSAETVEDAMRAVHIYIPRTDPDEQVESITKVEWLTTNILNADGEDVSSVRSALVGQ